MDVSESIVVNAHELFRRQGRVRNLLTRRYNIHRSQKATLTSEQVKEVVSRPIELSSREHEETFESRGRPTLREYFAGQLKGIQEGIIKTFPVELFKEQDERDRLAVENAGPIRITVRHVE